MKSKIVFFDNPKESANGTLRGLINLLILLPCYYLISKLIPKHFKFSKGTPFWLLAMACGIGVIEPKSRKELLFFGSCVGLLIFCYDSFKSIDKFSFKTTKNIGLKLLVGILLGFITSTLLWYVYWDNKFLRIPGKYNIQWQILNFFFAFIIYNENIFV